MLQQHKGFKVQVLWTTSTISDNISIEKLQQKEYAGMVEQESIWLRVQSISEIISAVTNISP